MDLLIFKHNHVFLTPDHISYRFKTSNCFLFFMPSRNSCTGCTGLDGAETSLVVLSVMPLFTSSNLCFAFVGVSLDLWEFHMICGSFIMICGSFT